MRISTGHNPVVLTPLPANPYAKNPKAVMSRVTAELEKKTPDSKAIIAALDTLSPHDQMSYARQLRLDSPSLWSKLGSIAVRDGGDMKIVILSEEPKKSRQIVESSARIVGSRAIEMEENLTLTFMRKVHPAERGAVIAELRETNPRGYAALRAICKNSGDRDLIEAFRDSERGMNALAR